MFQSAGLHLSRALGLLATEHRPVPTAVPHLHRKAGLVIPTLTCCGSHTYFSFPKKRRLSIHIQKAPDKSKLNKKDELEGEGRFASPKDPGDARNCPLLPSSPALWPAVRWGRGSQSAPACCTTSGGSYPPNGLPAGARPTSHCSRRTVWGSEVILCFLYERYYLKGAGGPSLKPDAQEPQKT